jgi:DNA-3-methyladenine glycosylase
MYDCLNIVTETAGRPAAVLVRAVEPLAGVAEMRAARLARWRDRRRAVDPEAEQTEAARLARLPADRLASGPGLVTAALGIDRSMTGLDLTDATSPLRVEPAPNGEPPLSVIATPRVGITYAGEPWTAMPWRFIAAGHPSVSGPGARQPG